MLWMFRFFPKLVIAMVSVAALSLVVPGLVDAAERHPAPAFGIAAGGYTLLCIWARRARAK